MSAPTVPKRPGASQNIDIPTIPPRPRRGLDRSVSPSRGSYTRSPLNDPAFFPPNGRVSGPSSLSKSIPKELLNRPPSVNLPSVGQEGAEYAHLDDVDDAPSETTKTVSGELPLLAPKASLPASTAKSRISAVTRTDSNAAAAIGLGKPSSEAGDSHPHISALAQEISRSNSSQQRSRPASLYRVDTEDESEHGIPEIGMQIPLYPNAGDVQAPTPATVGASAPHGSAPHSGETRNHVRTKSGREVFGAPPGSYGRHGHGVVAHNDPFEKAWYDKHPEALAREAEGEYGPRIPMERKDYHLDSTRLNKLVHEPLNDELTVGTPDEHIGYLAHEEYAQRVSRPASAAKRKSLQYTESPLRKMSSHSTEKPDLSAEDADDDEVIHVEHPAITVDSDDSATPEQAEDSHEQPILAADEVAKRPEGQFMTPAIDNDERRRNSFMGDLPLSRPHSRSSSVQISAPPVLPRATSDRENTSTPLDNVQEYEPLFPEDEDPNKKKAPSVAEDHAPRHYFPSKDVWEDNPESLMHETTVKTPQMPEFSRPEAEHEPREIFDADDGAVSRAAPVSAKPMFKKEVLSDMTRPSVRHRFPSQDTWEDAPDSLMHTTVVDEDESSQPSDSKGVPQIPARPAKPVIPARPARSVAPKDQEDSAPTDVVAASKSKPPVPPRPMGSKISALRGAFMSNLQSKLEAGPQSVLKAPESEEEVAEKAPLQDARKGRAKGPARRKPGVSPASGSDGPRSAPKVSFVSAVTVWEINEDGALDVKPKDKGSSSTGAPPEAEEV